MRKPGGKAAYDSTDMDRPIIEARRRRAGNFPLQAAVAALLVMALAVFPARAQQASDGVGQGHAAPRVVDFAFVKSLVVFPGRPDLTIVDSRSDAAGYNASHIPRAINIPAAGFGQFAALLPLDRRHILLFYCADALCEEGRQSADKAAALGYMDVRLYAAGFADWLKNGGPTAVSAAFVTRLVHSGVPHTIVDARPVRSAAKGMIPGAINIPDADFEKRSGQLPADKAALLIFYCGGIDCPQSAISAEKARKLGYTNVHTYPEGYPEWIQLRDAAQPAVGATGN